MKIYQPSTLLNFLKERGLTAKKNLSQNFLVDRHILDKILELAEIVPGESVLEIGPGPGALTEALIDAGANVLAVEKDEGFAKALERFETVDIVCGDILKFDLPDGPYKVLSNLPYHLTTPILKKLLPQNDKITSMTIMVQDDAAHRIMADVGESGYGALSVFVRSHAITRYGFPVKATSFFPKPHIDSAVIRLDLKNVSPPPTLFEVIKLAFQKRRKMLRGIFPESALTRANLDPTARPETLSLNAFCALASSLEESTPQEG